MSQPNLKTAEAGYLPPSQANSKGLLQRKCNCGNHSNGGECESCNKKKIQRKLSVGASNDPLEQEADRVADQVMAGSVVTPVNSFQAPLVQRDGPAEKTDEDKYKEGGKKLAEAFLETSVGKQLTEDAKKAMFDSWKGRIITGSVAVGTITALAASEEELPVQLPEIPLDFFTPGLSVKFEYNGPVNKPSGAALTFIFKEQVQGKKKSPEKYPELAAIRERDKMFPRPQPAGFDQKFWDQYQLQELQKRLPALKPAPLLTPPEKKSPFQLTTPDFSSGFGYQLPPLFGDQFKFKPDDDKKKKQDEDKVQKKSRVGASNDPLETEADAVAEQVLSGSTSSIHITPVSTSIQRTSTTENETSAPASVDQAVTGSGQPLDGNTRDFMESRFGQDFSQVRIHTGSTAAQSARDINANAYTLGNSIVFGTGQYNPASTRGKRLLAHELTHVLQQSNKTSTPVQREMAKKTTSPTPVIKAPQKQKKENKKNEKKEPKKTAADAPKLDVTSSKKGAPCACVVVIHNNEQNARKTAELMHANCAYNLALVNPDTRKREVNIPGKKGTVDPNSLFPPDIAESCTKNPKECSDFLVNKASSTNQAEIEKFIQIQYFMAISNCSNGFTLPVVALHNNDTADTKDFNKIKDKADKKDIEELKLDIDKSTKETGDDRIGKLKNIIKKNFGGEKVVKDSMETAGKTNIFRWCASKDLSQCHIGDPAHPDNVVWVTNLVDFNKLKTRDINVALQSELPGKKSESEGDLSTLFLHLPTILAKGAFNNVSDILSFLRIFHPEVFVHEHMVAKLEEILTLIIKENLHYINIETPGTSIASQNDAERIRNYEAIVAVLDSLGLHCCGSETSKADEAIKAGLALDKKKAEDNKNKKAKK